MCIAIPMKVLSAEGVMAECEGRGERRRVNTALLDGVAAGQWLLVHVNTAREIVDAQRAALVNDALDALELAMMGGSVEGLFADLTEREPELPEFLSSPRSTPEA